MFLIGDVVGADAVASALTTGVTAQALWGAIAPYAAFLATMIIFAFGYRFFKRIISKASKGKA